MKHPAALLLGFAVLLLTPEGSLASHSPPHDTRPNPNCAWDSSRSTDWDHDGRPDGMVAGVSHNTSFPAQVMELTGLEAPEPVSWLGANQDGPDDLTVVVQGDHRLFGANPQEQPDGEPEQLHNGAIYAHVDYNEIEDGRAPRADVGAGVYEADHLAMACTSTDAEQPTMAACLAGNKIYMSPDGDCPTG